MTSTDLIECPVLYDRRDGVRTPVASPMLEVRRRPGRTKPRNDDAAEIPPKSPGLTAAQQDEPLRERIPSPSPSAPRPHDTAPRIRTGHEDHYVGETPLLRLSRKLVAARSLLALDYLTVTDAVWRDLENVEEMPFVIDVCYGGRPREWIPDYLVVRKGRIGDLVMVRTLGWLHPTSSRRRDHVLERLATYREAARVNGFGFRLYTEEQVRVQPRLYNAKLLARHVSPFMPRAEIVAAIDALGDLPTESSVPALGERLGRPDSALRLALNLHWLGHVRMDPKVYHGRDTGFTKP